MTTAIYVRISNDREGRELGVQRQEEACRALAAALGLASVEVFSDNDISASRRSSKPRPRYQKMLDAVRDGRITTAIVYSTSRLTRRPREVEDLIDLVDQHGLKIHTVVSGQIDLSTGAGRTVAGILAQIDAGEADTIRERVLAKQAQKRAAGEWSGGKVPFGFEPDGVTPRPAEQDMIRAAAADVLARRSLNGIARDWGKLMPPPSWHPPLVVRWKANTVRGILTKERAVGRLPDGTTAVWDPVLDEATWLGVRAVLDDPARNNTRPGASIRLLTGIAVCGKCGAPIGGSGRGKYRCSVSRHLDRQVGYVDDYVRDVVLGWLASNQITVDKTTSGPSTGDLAGRAAGIRARLAELEAAMKDARGRAVAMLVSSVSELDAELLEVEAAMAEAAGTSALAGLPADEEELAAIWARADNERRRSLLKAVPLSIKVFPPGRGARVFDPDTVLIERV